MAGKLLWLMLLAGPAIQAQDQPRFTPQEQAWQVLREGLEQHRASKRLEAVKALSLLSGHRQALSFALRAMHDPSRRVRAAACGALGQLRAQSAIPALHGALSDKDPSVVLAAAHALLLLKDNVAYAVYYAVLMGDRKSSQGVVDAQLDRLKDPKQVAELGVREGLGFVPFGGMGIEAYRALARRDSSPVRAVAARFLAHDPDPISEDALVQTALSDNHSTVRQAALDALAERGDAACRRRLLKNLSDSDDAVRYHTAAAILHLGDSLMRPRSKRANP